MVPKRLYGYYLTSYEQFYVFQKIYIGFTSVILKNSYFYQRYGFTIVFLAQKSENKFRKCQILLGFQSICRRILRKKSLFLGEKSIKCPVL